MHEFRKQKNERENKYSVYQNSLAVIDTSNKFQFYFEGSELLIVI